MIQKITMRDVASYKKEAILATDKRVNLIYGLNGVGKSTITDYLYDRNNPRFSSCVIEGLEQNDLALVYNQTFVQDYFYETSEIQGIFTLSKENTESKRIIEAAKKTITEKSKEKDALTEKFNQRKELHEKNIDQYKKEAWKIKTQYSGGDRVLEFCLDGLKGNKDSLMNHLLSIQKKDTVAKTIEELKKEARELQGDVHAKTMIDSLKIDVENIEASELLSKVIVGNKDSSIAKAIDDFGNSDWVSQGLEYVDENSEPAVCPFCHQETITKEFIKSLKDYFDESYKKDVDMLEELKRIYANKTSQAVNYIENINDDSLDDSTRKELNSLVSELRHKIQVNTSELEKKIKTPSEIVTLESTKDIENQINSLIERVNHEIAEYNAKIADIQGSKKSIKDAFWATMRLQYDSIVEVYLKEIDEYSAYEENYKTDLKTFEDAIKIEQERISDNQKKTVNIDEAVENIKAGLLDIGIMDFTIEKYSEEDALYKLQRGDDSADFETLSEGEKMVISFLYFIELCKGLPEADKSVNNRIVIIDDPISSLSHIYVFNIGRMIHEEFLRGQKYNQVFIFTHSLYFFYELTKKSSDERHKTQKLFRIEKDTITSKIVEMDYNEIQNDYQAYWLIVKDEKQSPALIANCMRNIIDYFFGFVEKKSLNDVFQSPELKGNRFQAFYRYMNRESHSDGQNIFDLKEFDYQNFKDAFELVFKIKGYEDHYNKMIK